MWTRKVELDWGRIPRRLSRLQCPASDDPFTSWNNFRTSNKLCFVFYAIVLIRSAICMLWWKASFSFPIPACLIQFNYFGNLFIHCAKCIFWTIILTITDFGTEGGFRLGPRLLWTYDLIYDCVFHCLIVSLIFCLKALDEMDDN